MAGRSVAEVGSGMLCVRSCAKVQQESSPIAPGGRLQVLLERMMGLASVLPLDLCKVFGVPVHSNESTDEQLMTVIFAGVLGFADGVAKQERISSRPVDDPIEDVCHNLALLALVC